MKTTEKLLKTLLMSLILVSCLGANAMAEENTDDKSMNVTLNLVTSYEWEIPPGITINPSEIDLQRGYETTFDVKVKSVTLKPEEKVQISMAGSTNGQFSTSSKNFFMKDLDNPSNDNSILFKLYLDGSSTSLGQNAVVLKVGADDFTDINPVSSTLKLVMAYDSAMRVVGNYQANVIFQAGVVTEAA